MRRIYIVCFTFLLLFVAAPRIAHAACELAADPPSGTDSTTYQVKIDGCPANTSLLVAVLSPTTDILSTYTADLPASGTIGLTVFASGATQTGTYRVVLMDNIGTIFAEDSIQVTVGTTPGSKQCGDVSAINDPQCPANCQAGPAQNVTGLPGESRYFCTCGIAGFGCCKSQAIMTTGSSGCGNGLVCQQGSCVTQSTAQGGATSVQLQGACQTKEIDTAIGCIPVGNLNDFSAFFLRWGLGLSGGLAIVMLIYSSFLIMTSAGDPKRLDSGKELLSSVMSGIVLMTFCVFILRLIGINVLGIF